MPPTRKASLRNRQKSNSNYLSYAHCNRSLLKKMTEGQSSSDFDLTQRVPYANGPVAHRHEPGLECQAEDSASIQCQSRRKTCDVKLEDVSLSVSTQLRTNSLDAPKMTKRTRMLFSHLPFCQGGSTRHIHADQMEYISRRGARRVLTTSRYHVL